MTGLEGVLEPEVLPALAEARDVDVGREVRRWWEQQDLGDTVDVATLAVALADVGVLSLAYLAKALTDPTMPDADKLKIALTMSPRLIAEARGRLRGGGRNGAAAPKGEGEGADLMESYGLKVTTK